MSQHIIKQLARDIRHAFFNGQTTVVAFSHTFIIEHVNRREYRVTDAAGADIGFRFVSDGVTFRFIIA